MSERLARYVIEKRVVRSQRIAAIVCAKETFVSRRRCEDGGRLWARVGRGSETKGPGSSKRNWR